MKRKFFAALLVLVMMLCLTATAFAEHLTGANGWTVTFTSEGKIASNFSSGSIQDAVSALQPGDDITLTVTLANEYKDSVDWYMMNTILKALEDGTAAAGGAYAYVLTYTGTSGTNELYNSDRVGGELGGSTAPEGLHEVNDALKDYFYLETMNKGGTGTVTLKVTLDGDTLNNGYQGTLADLRMRFAAEITPTRTVVVTGDSTNFKPYYIGMSVAGLLALVLAVDGMVQRKKAGRKGA